MGHLDELHEIRVVYRCGSMGEHNGVEHIRCKPGVAVWSDWLVFWTPAGEKISGPRQPNRCCRPAQITCRDGYEHCLIRQSELAVGGGVR